MQRLSAFYYRLLPIHAGIIATFLLIPVWYRLPQRPDIFPALYVSRFLILLPMLWTIGWWLALRLPGFDELRRDKLRRIWALALLLLAVWAFASQSWAFRRVENPDYGATAALQLSISLLFSVVIACACPPKPALIAALLTGLVWNSLLAIAQVANQQSLGLNWLGEFRFNASIPGTSVVQADGIRWLRPYGLLPHPNMLAGFLMIALLAACAAVLSRRLVVWWVGTLIALLGLWALLLTFSRASWGGLILGGLIMLPFLWRARLRERDSWLPVLTTLGLMAGVIVIFGLLYSPFLLARAGVGTESIELRSISDRALFTEFALRAVREFPVGGVGIGNFPWRASYYLIGTGFDLRGDNVHNIFLSAWSELGTVGLVLVLTALIAGIAVAFRQLRQQPDLGSIALFGGFVALTATGLLDHYPWTLIQFQVAWWGFLAAAGTLSASEDKSRETN